MLSDLFGIGITSAIQCRTRRATRCRISLARRPDHEPLTDLITVFYGLGIFTANAAYERRPRPNGRGKQPLARGYLREAALSEALAYYAKLRGERHPDWDRHLDAPVRRGLRNQLVVLHR